MATSIDNAFIKQFEREVHEAYQRFGSKMRPTVRTIGNVNGSSAIFQKVGKGAASTKSAHGMVPVMNLAHTAIEVALQDYYAGDWVDRLDEMKVNIDERQVIANAGAYALGRKTDELIITAMNGVGSGQKIADSNVGMTKDKILAAYELLGAADVPDDGQRFGVVGWKQWSELLKLPEFASADYVGTEDPAWRGTGQAKFWLGTYWFQHSGLPKDGNDIRSCFWYHRNALGHAANSDIQTDITWHGDRAAHFVNNMMSQGAALIDESGIVSIGCDETPD